MVYLEKVFQKFGLSELEKSQLFSQFYKRLSLDFDKLANLKLSIRSYLKSHPPDMPILVDQKENLHTIKFLWQKQGLFFETVLIKHAQRNTVCISVQSGCAVGCVFCATGRMGLKGQLSTDDILYQVWYAKKWLRMQHQKLSNVVFMGMGEPFQNYGQLIQAIGYLKKNEGFSFSPKRITVSTVGIPEKIIQFAKDARGVSLAISLHSTSNKVRSKLIPVNAKYPVEEIQKAIEIYWDITGGQKIMLEFTLIDGINDSLEDAHQIGQMFYQKPVLVNLLSCNDTIYRGSPFPKVFAFYQVLRSYGIFTTIRKRMGFSINAACGQLAYFQENHVS